MRFSLVDRITSLEAGRSITAVKNLSLAEEYLADHFPGVPVMPGVLMLESLVQAGAWLMRYTEDFLYSTILLKQAKSLRFRSFVSPGQTLTVNATVVESQAGYCVLKGSGTVEGVAAVAARLTLEQFNLSERDPELAESDRLRVEHARRQFREIWSPESAPPQHAAP